MEGGYSHGYKQAKEDFVSGMTGSSITHVNLISLVALTSVALYTAIHTRTKRAKAGAGAGFLASWALLVLPMLLAMTLAADYPYILWMNVGLVGGLGWVMRMPVVERGTPLPSSRGGVGADARRGGVGAGGGGGGSGGGRGAERDGEERWAHAEGKDAARLPPLPALTTYRAHMMLMTVLAILAVDFPVFPRSLAKCESFGVSLMDLGVGSFVFSQGLVSALPLVKDPMHLRSPLAPKLRRAVRKSLPVIALGVLRVLLVKGTEYPEHVTEYGVHWNFFITLGLLPVLQVFLHPLLVLLPISISMLGVLVAFVQQILLSRYGLGLQDYVLHAPRTSLVSMNKEGLVSLLGYLSIQLLGLSAGTIVLPPTPSFFSRRQKALDNALHLGGGVDIGVGRVGKGRKRRNSDSGDSDDDDDDDDGQAEILSGRGGAGAGAGLVGREFALDEPRQLDKTATELCAYSIVWWAMLGVVRLAAVGGGASTGISRRMVNLSYILWVAAFNVSFLLCYIVVLDLWIASSSPSPAHSKTKAKAKAQSRRSLDGDGQTPAMRMIAMNENENENENPPRLLEAVNEYGLYVFLLANALTGLINLSMSTMYMSDAKALLVLSAYSMVCCGVPWFLSARSRSSRSGNGTTGGIGLGVGSEDKYK